MRVGVIAPLVVRVPPPGYGGTEQVVSVLTEELVRRSHQVTLFATADSITNAELRSVRPRGLKEDGVTEAALSVEAALHDSINAATCFERASDFDIIHNHAAPVTMMQANLVSTPMLMTIHNPVSEDVAAVMSAFKGYYNTISRSAKRGLPDRGYIGAVYNDIDVESFPFNSSQREGYLLSLGRVCHDKGTHLAIEVGQRLNRRVVIAGNVNEHDREYFETMIEPHIDGELIRYFGEATREETRQLYYEADCFLFPIQWEEIFGLVMIEAMACGTPVVAFNRGSVPEVVIDGETGFIVNDIDAMVEATRRTGEINRLHCRDHVKLNFNAPRMADGYLTLYQQILDGES